MGVASLIFAAVNFSSCGNEPVLRRTSADSVWYGWNKFQIKPEDTLAKYGRQLIENTSYYLGPSGKVSSYANGMNCQNCHYEGGTRPFGNNYSAVVSNYPKFRARSGTVESITKRINDCIERSLHGKALDTTSLEMRSIVAYMHWVGDEIPKGVTPKGAGIYKLKFLERAADPGKGIIVYQTHCVKCHGIDGQGLPYAQKSGYEYPPLWGPHSYTTGAGLYRISNFAGLVKMNMPFGTADFLKPVLTDEDAWDVAAYVNAQERPVFDVSADWPKIENKPFDNPTGPFADSFLQAQHKFGPFSPIQTFYKKLHSSSTKK